MNKEKHAQADSNLEELLVEALPIIQFVKVVGCNSLNVREKPNKESAILQVVRSGTVIEVKRFLKSWVQVSVNGIDGYVMSSFTEKV